MISIETNEMTAFKAFLTNYFINVFIIWYNLNTKMSSMKPIFTDDALQHYIVHFIIGVRIRFAASTVESSEIVVVAVIIYCILVGTQCARHHPRELAVSTITAEIPLCVQFGELVTIMAHQTTRKAYTSRLAVICAASGTSIQCLTLHVALIQHKNAHIITSLVLQVPYITTKHEIV